MPVLLALSVFLAPVHNCVPTFVGINFFVPPFCFTSRIKTPAASFFLVSPYSSVPPLKI